MSNVTRVPRLQELFARHGVRPTYLITHPVAVDREAVGILGRYQREGACEIGTHLHPWNTPPAIEERTGHNSFTNNLPAQLQYRKLDTLHRAIAGAFGRAPTSYRSGRWGFDDDVARNLIRLGYHVDTSIYPAWDWSGVGGPDYRRATVEPFVYRVDADLDGPAGTLLEVPATVDFLQRHRRAAAAAFWTIKSKLPAPDQVLAVLRRLHLLNHVCLSPELSRASHMIALARTLIDRGAPVINMFFHSPSLLPKCSPFVGSDAEAEAFLDRIDEFLRFAGAAGLRPVTMSELTAETVGATTVRRLSAA